ncbi:uncharacterized protein [Macrobrachium rosenbergii]|uniref:uncharacterized protein n=1 Tax=Macrobrachium rosenbergii TaxID=79674 RepID=UPI0034D3D8A4
MDDEKLISLVQSHGCLYNSSHKHYNDQVKREKVWIEIGKILNQPGVTCKSRWSNLRDQFRRATKTKRTLNGESSEKKKWKFDKEMAFLKPYYHERCSVQNNSSDPDEVLEVAWQEGGTDAEVESSPSSPARKKPMVEAKDQGISTKASKLAQHHEETDVRMEANTQSCSTPMGQPVHSQTLRRSRPVFSGPYYLQRSQDVRRSTDHIDAFLFGIAETVKLFPPVYQHMAKSKIFSAVSELEMEVLMKAQVPSDLKGQQT